VAQPWDAERAVDADLARSLIESQFPRLAPVHLEPFGEGWDNTAYLANDSIVFRFPRRQVSVPLMEGELRILPRIAAALPVAIPNPSCAGRPDARYPWPFSGYFRLPGRTADRVSLDDPGRSELAVPLARFLAALQALTGDDAGPDTIGRLDVDRLAARIRRSIGSQGDRVIEAGREARPSGRRTLVHGDLYVRHLLVEDGRLSGVIDWGDVHCGDPAVDLSIAWSFLPARARVAFRQAYGPIDEDSWRLARLRALHYGVVLADYGRETADAHLVRESATILRFSLGE
jgi:aminoglycoside phosphotransferase (APT) family kinase protein